MSTLPQPSLFDGALSHKTCPRCCKPKPANEFRTKAYSPDGLYPCCKKCDHANKKSATPDKWCPRCQQWLSSTLFNKATSRADGLKAFCRDCGNKATRAIYRSDINATRSKMRAAHFKRSYGITVEEYDALLAKQNGVCAICRGDESTLHWGGKRMELAVDHNHKTGQVRGLLCTRCNQGIGHFQDCCERLRAAVAYLEDAT